MQKHRTHTDFLAELLIKNKHYKQGSFTVIGEYINALSNIRVGTFYGECLVEANSLLKGNRPTIQVAIDKNSYCKNMFNEMHQDKFDYSKIDYKGNNEDVEIICKKHGGFFQTPKEHVKGSGCPICAREVSNFRKCIWEENNKNKISVFYFIECWDNEERFLKIGITSRTLKERFPSSSKMPYNYTEISTIIGKTREELWDTEERVKKLFINYLPKIQFKGSKTECFNISDKKEIEKIIKNK